MQSIAVLLTCFNRKDKTLAALKALNQAHKSLSKFLILDIYLTDDGSTDGTSKVVKKNHPNVKVLPGNGELYWAGGMRNSWKEALKGEYDFYLLLNDDTEPYENFLQELINTHEYCLQKYGAPGVYVGTTVDKTDNISYGGSIFTNRFLAQYVRVIPNNQTPQECELGNANILLVHKDVVKKIGILTEGFVHGLADFDYTLKAKKAKIPVLIAAKVLGVCVNDHTDPYLTFHELSFQERRKKLYHPIGLDFKSQLQYMKRNFLYRLPLVYIAGWLKVLFPKFYYNKMYQNR